MSPGRRLLLVAIVVGGLLGAFSMLADGIIGGRLLGILGNIASPWALAAFLVGRRTASPRLGAAAGALTLVVGVTTYFLGTAIRGYVLVGADLVWTAVALVAGPVMGVSGAAIASRPARPPIPAVAVPSAMLVAEAIFLAVDRRVWRWNLDAEPYRLIDLGVIVALFLGGLALAAWFERDRRRRVAVFVAVAAAGVGGAVGLVMLLRLIVRII
jgi:Family of unknown function (DUF6518)